MFKIKLYAQKKSPFHKLVKEKGEGIQKLFTYYMSKAQKQAKLNVTGGGSSKTRLNVRSGRLRASITKKVVKSGRKFVGTIGTNVVYARIHEEGGTIKPVRRQYLTIPIGDAQ